MRLIRTDILIEDIARLEDKCGVYEDFGSFENREACMRKVVELVGNKPYMRFLMLDGAEAIDYGSWSHFFYIIYN